MKFFLILLVVVLISYGQLLGMHVWQDDNALFFKLAHIEEKAGYLSAGPFGNGPYKYIATPYIPIYNLFGHNTVPYFVLMISLYFVSVLVIHKVSSKILGNIGGKITAFLYAAGYIASDGFIRIFNSAATSISVIMISLLTFSYLNFFTKRQIRWYFLSLLSYFLTVELAQGRTHYLIAVVIIFELLYSGLKKFSVVRLMPFVFIFYKYFVENADSRSANVGKFLMRVLNGDLYQIFGFLTSTANLFVPDWVTKNIPIVFWIVIVFVSLIVILKGRLWLQISYSFAFLIWLFLSREIFSVPQLIPSPNQVNLAFLGGAVLLIISALVFVLKSKFVKLYLLFLFWALINMLAYSAYNPLVTYESINRYLAHSFFAVVFLLGTVFIGIKRKGLSRAVQLIVIVWGVGNLMVSVIYQKGVVANRSVPAREFYEQLQSFVPNVEKGDAIYFDVSDGDRSYFNDAFSVASMPETTAIAWRYGVDRYDLKIFTNFDEMKAEVKEGKINFNNIHSFWYDNQNLTDTTARTRDYFSEGLRAKKINFEKAISSDWENKEIAIDLSDAVVSSIPVNVLIDVKSSYPNLDTFDFPLISKGTTKRMATDPDFLRLATEYGLWKDSFKSIGVTGSSFWRERKTEYLNDSDISTVWQPDRIKFREAQEWLQIDLGKEMSISKLVWVNGFGNNTPTKYKVEVSKEGKIWTSVKEVNSIDRIDNRSPRIIAFAPINARFMRMTFLETLNSDSPGIAEVWVVPSSFDKLDIAAAENFLSFPFDGVPDLNTYNILKSFLAKGKVKVYWQIEGGDDWMTTETAYLNLVYDGKRRTYSVIIPPKGLSLKRIKLSDFSAPSNIIVSGLEVRWQRP